MTVSAAAQALQDAVARLAAAEAEVRDQWRDRQRDAFETRILRPLGREAAQSGQAIRDLADGIERAYRRLG